MNAIILRLKAEKAKLQKEYQELKIKAVRCIYELQNANPFFGDDISVINAESLQQSATELVEVKNKMAEIQTNIRKINNELGE